jgi:hypothetical protein
MRRIARSRDECVDVLMRRPQSRSTSQSRAESLPVDAAAQLRELATLLREGLLSAEDFERQRRKVLGP